MLDINMIKNIKEIENIKIKLLDNISKIFKSEEESEINIKEVLIDNIKLNKELAERLGIDIKIIGDENEN